MERSEVFPSGNAAGLNAAFGAFTSGSSDDPANSTSVGHQVGIQGGVDLGESMIGRIFGCTPWALFLLFYFWLHILLLRPIFSGIMDLIGYFR